MKKKKLVTAVCSIALAAASIGVFAPKIIGSIGSMDTVKAAADADATVKVSVSEESAKPGEAFKLSVDLSGVPSSGVNCCELGIEYNANVVSVSKVSKGSAVTAIDENELYTKDNTINLGYASIDGVIKKDGSILVIEGKVKDNAKAGDKSDFKIVPIKRAVTPGSSTKISSIYIGYVGDDNTVSAYKTTTIDGVVKVVSDTAVTTAATTKAPDETTAKPDETTKAPDKTTAKPDETTKATEKTTAKTTKKTTTTTKKTTITIVTAEGNHDKPGDVTMDDKVSVSDLVVLQKYLVKNYKFQYDKQYELADVNGDKVINVFDVVALRKALLK